MLHFIFLRKKREVDLLDAIIITAVKLFIGSRTRQRKILYIREKNGVCRHIHTHK